MDAPDYSESDEVDEEIDHEDSFPVVRVASRRRRKVQYSGSNCFISSFFSFIVLFCHCRSYHLLPPNPRHVNHHQFESQRNNVIPPEVARQDGSSGPLFDQRQSVSAEGANVRLQPDEFAESAVSPQSLGQLPSSELPPAYSPLSEVEGVVVGSMMAEPVLPVFHTLTVYS